MRADRVVEGNRTTYRHSPRTRQITAALSSIVVLAILVGIVADGPDPGVIVLALALLVICLFPLRIVRGFVEFDQLCDTVRVQRSFRRLELKFSDVEEVFVSSGHGATYLRLHGANLPRDPDRYHHMLLMGGEGICLRVPVSGERHAEEIASLLQVALVLPDADALDGTQRLNS